VQLLDLHGRHASNLCLRRVDFAALDARLQDDRCAVPIAARVGAITSMSIATLNE
jgi:hypothetical protein